MVLLNDEGSQLAMIMGKYVMSANAGFTDVIGGTMTAGALTAAQGSALITWSPAMISQPIIMGMINSGAKAATSVSVRFTGVGVSNAYVMMAAGNNACSQATISVVVIGEARL